MRRGRNEGSAGHRPAAQNPPSAAGNTSRRGMISSLVASAKDAGKLTIMYAEN